MELTELAGHAGAFLSSVTFIPQVFKAWKSKRVGDLSLTMILIVFGSTIVWLYYAFSLSLLPVIIANSIICALSLVLLGFKFRFKE